MTRKLHPKFDPIVETGRTSSFGDLNAQNLPREGGVRECIIPPEGHVFVLADFSTVELGTLAQSLQSQWGLDSAMAAAINLGVDLHTQFAAQVTGKQAQDVTKEER